MSINQDPTFTPRTAAEETWRIFRIISEFVEGFEVMAGVGPAVSIFGSARTPEDDPYYKQARELAALLSQRGFAIITGGGPGIMEAANRGAMDVDGQSIGLNISLPMEQVPNPYQNVRLDFNYFFVRKVMFVKYAMAFACFPGGFGTMDEFFESMTLMQTGKTPRMKVVLLGKQFWEPLVDWIRETMLGVNHNISPDDMNLFSLTDDVHEACEMICAHHKSTAQLQRSFAGGDDAQIARPFRMTAEGTLYGVTPRPTPPSERDGQASPEPPEAY